MALDNAQFMSELSITDPPGTDPLSEGDDQIRTSKRTQLQSFPLVDKQVDLSADDLNNLADAAIIDEFNIFTVQQTFEQDVIRTVAAASNSGLFFNNSETGFRRWAFGREDTTSSGDWIIQRRDTAGAITDIPFRITEARGVLLMTGGRAADPAYSFQLNPDMGMYEEQAGVIGFAAAGTQVFRMTNSNTTFAAGVQMRAGSDGTAGLPAYAFTSNTNIGMYIDAQNDLAFAVGQGSGVLIAHAPSGVIGMPFLQTGSAGLVSGDLFKSVSAPGFIEIVP